VYSLRRIFALFTPFLSVHFAPDFTVHFAPDFAQTGMKSPKLLRCLILYAIM
jgi:hypothetical protein